MAESINSENQQVKGAISIYTVVGAVGYALFLSSFLIGIYGTPLSTIATKDPSSFSLVRAITLASVVVTFFSIYRFTLNRGAFIRSKFYKCLFYILSVQLPIMHLIELAFGIAFFLPIICISWVLWGVANGYFICSWIDGLNNIDDDYHELVDVFGFTTAGIIAICVLSMPVFASVIAYVAFSTISFLILIKGHATPTANSFGPIDENWIREAASFKKTGSYILFVDGVILANIACFILVKIIRLELTPTLIGALIVSAMALFCLIRKTKPSILSLESSQMVFLPFIASSLFLMPYLDGLFQIAIASFLFVVMFIFDTMNSIMLSARCGALSVPPSLCYAKGRIYIIAGQSVGWILGSLLAMTPSRLLPVLFSILLFLLCFYNTLSALNPDNFSFTSTISKASKTPSLAECNKIELDHQNEPKKNSFKEKVARAALFYDLTPREGEVLFYLARGRNAKYAADKLFVAERTVKTHTYHIYQKMNVHSQQELINVIDGEESSTDEK